LHGSDSLPGRKQRCGRYWYTVLEHCGAADADDAGESTCPSGFRLLAPNLYGGCSSPAIYHIVQDPPEIGVDDVLIEESMGRSGWRRDIKIGGMEGGREAELYGPTMPTVLGPQRCLSICPQYLYRGTLMGRYAIGTD